MQGWIGPLSLFGDHSESLAQQQVNSLHPSWLLQAELCPVAQVAKLRGRTELGVLGAQRGTGELPGQARCKARAAVRDRNRNRVS